MPWPAPASRNCSGRSTRIATRSASAGGAGGAGARGRPPARAADRWHERVAGLLANDRLCATLGITFRAGGPGSAEVAMTVAAQHLNFNGACHGGAIFALADSAFSLASNSHGPDAAGIDVHVTFQAAVAAGDTLVARASEVQRSRRIGVYRIDVVRRKPTAARRPSRASPARSTSRAEPPADRDTPEGVVP